MINKVEIAFNNWKSRVKNGKINAICKPCWELNYCPYGSLVEDFPINDHEDYTCRIFGHTCPVFIVAEPFTETRKQRNISRNIPQVVKFEVFKRDNQVCQVCRKNIPYDEINFDHIIPWSKGGSSEASNIRILCESCNKSRGINYESEYLNANMIESYYDPIDLNIEQVEDLLRLSLLWNTLEKNGVNPSEKIFCEILNGDDTSLDAYMYSITSQLMELLKAGEPFIKVKIKMNMLLYRWGVTDGSIHSINETCDKFKKDTSYYVEVEMLLLRKIGYILKKKFQKTKEYLDLNANLPHINLFD